MVNIYDVKVSKHGSTKKLKTIRVAGMNIVQASHMAMEIAYNTDMFRGKCVEITGIKKNKNVKYVEGLDDVFSDGDGDEDMINPLDISGVAEDDLIIFKHNCDSTIKLVDGNWGIVKCPSCSKPILRRNLSQVSGMWIYVEGKL